jgi:uncharacterized membrane protein
VSTVKTDTLAASALHIDWPRAISIGLCVLGLLVAGYMSWAEITGNETVCANTGSIDCSAVQQSAYAKTFGFPVAVMGFLGYIAILAALALEDQLATIAAYGRTLVVGMALFGFMFQTYLMYVEAAVLEKWCQWCVASHVVIMLLLIIGVYRLYRFLQPLRQ